MPHSLRRPIGALALALFPAFSAPAQEPAKPPVFKAGTEIVLVDLIVSDKANRLVKGLSAKDFVVREDGKERPIVSFTAFAGSESPSALDSDAVSVTSSRDRRPGGAATVILVDDGQLTPQQGQRLVPELKALLAKVSERSGSLALVAPWSKVSEARALPSGAEDLASAVERIKGTRFDDLSTLPVADAEAIAVERGDPTMLARVSGRFMALNPSLHKEQAEPLARTRSIEVAFEAKRRRDVAYGVILLSLDWLASQPGRHSLVMVSAGFARDPEDQRYKEIVTRSLRVNAPIHFLDARGLQGLGRFQSVAFGGGALNRDVDETPFARSDASEGSTALADATGGITIRNTNDIEKSLARLLDTMQTYYVLGYEAPPHGKPGFRRIKVDARPKDLTVRARRGYFDGGKH